MAGISEEDVDSFLAQTDAPDLLTTSEADVDAFLNAPEAPPAAPEPQVGVAETLTNQVGDSLLMGGLSKANGAGNAILAKTYDVLPSWVGEMTGVENRYPQQDAKEAYVDARDMTEQRQAAGSKQNPRASVVGTAIGTGLGMAVPLGAVGRAAQGLKGWQKAKAMAQAGAKVGAGMGALGGAMSDRTDFMDEDGISAQDARDFGSSIETGMFLGGGMGAGGGVAPEALAAAGTGVAAFGDKLCLSNEERAAIGTGSVLGGAGALMGRLSAGAANKLGPGIRDAAGESRMKVGQRLLDTDFQTENIPYQSRKADYDANVDMAKARDQENALGFQARLEEYRARQEANKAMGHEKTFDARKNAILEKLQKIDQDEADVLATGGVKNYGAQGRVSNKKFRDLLREENARLAAAAKDQAQMDGKLQDAEYGIDQALVQQEEAVSGLEKTALSRLGEASKKVIRGAELEAQGYKVFGDDNKGIASDVVSDFAGSIDETAGKLRDAGGKDGFRRRVIEEGMPKVEQQNDAAIEQALLEAMGAHAEAENFKPGQAFEEKKRGLVTEDQAREMAANLGLQLPAGAKFWDKSTVLPQIEAAPLTPDVPTMFDKARGRYMKQLESLSLRGPVERAPKAPESELRKIQSERPTAPTRKILKSGSVSGKDLLDLTPRVDAEVAKQKVSGAAGRKALKMVTFGKINPDDLMAPGADEAGTVRMLEAIADRVAKVPELNKKYGTLFNQGMSRMQLYMLLKKDPDLTND